jgi:hypothetical protein
MKYRTRSNKTIDLKVVNPAPRPNRTKVQHINFDRYTSIEEMELLEYFGSTDSFQYSHQDLN